MNLYRLKSTLTAYHVSNQREQWLYEDDLFLIVSMTKVPRTYQLKLIRLKDLQVFYCAAQIKTLSTIFEELY